MNTTTATETQTFDLVAINRGISKNKAAVQVHRKGCADLKKNTRGASIWEIKARSFRDVIEDVCEDFIAENEGATWEDYTAEADLNACCPEMPYDHEAAAEAPEPKKARVNQEALIMDYLRKHRGVNYTPHTLAKALGHNGLRDALARLADKGEIDIVADAPRAYCLRAVALPKGRKARAKK